MATLQIRKETNKVWRHVPSDALPYIVSKLYIKSDGDFIRVVEQGGSQRGQYNFADVSVYNIGGVAETFGSAQQLMERLEALNYIGFFYEGEVSPSELISSDVDNAIELGTDGKLFAPISGGAVDSVNGQTGVVVLDATDVSALSNDVADYTDATTPLAGTEIALVEQGGTFKKVAVSEFGGGAVSAEDIFTYFKGDLYVCQATGSALTNIGGVNPALVGTGSNLVSNFAANYTTSPFSTWNSRRQVSSAAAGSSAEIYRSENKICSVGLGFYRSGKIANSTTTNSRSFFGLNDSLSATGNVNPSTLSNILGFGNDIGDGNLQIIHNDNSGIATKVDLGTDFLINTTNAYLYEIWNFQGSNNCYFRIKNLITNTTSAIIEVTTDLPTINDGLTMHDWINNGTDASAVNIYFTNITTKRQS